MRWNVQKMLVSENCIYSRKAKREREREKEWIREMQFKLLHNSDNFHC